jgi:hypothetical protein
MAARSEHPVPSRARVARVDEPSVTVSLLRAEHALLEKLTQDILQRIVVGDHDDLCRAVGLLQASVEAHLEDEENGLLPIYAKHDPADAALIRRDHASIRKALAELDLFTDLHSMRAGAMAVLLESLCAHGVREDARFYRWAEQAPELEWQR